MSEFIRQIETLLSAFADPEYRYLALEPLIAYGLLAGIGMLIGGFIAKAPRLQVAALIVISLAAMTHFPYRDARLNAKPRLDQVYKHDAPSRVAEFAATTQQWSKTSWLFRLLIVCAFATLLIGIQRNKLGFNLSILTIILSLLCMKNAFWLNYQDALAYHPNLKQHRAPIDQRVSESSSSRQAAPLVAQPIAPAVVAEPIPTPARATPVPERISAPPTPSTASSERQARRVQPLSRY